MDEEDETAIRKEEQRDEEGESQVVGLFSFLGQLPWH